MKPSAEGFPKDELFAALANACGKERTIETLGKILKMFEMSAKGRPDLGPGLKVATETVKLYAQILDPNGLADPTLLKKLLTGALAKEPEPAPQIAAPTPKAAPSPAPVPPAKREPAPYKHGPEHGLHGRYHYNSKSHLAGEKIIELCRQHNVTEFVYSRWYDEIIAAGYTKGDYANAMQALLTRGAISRLKFGHYKFLNKITQAMQNRAIEMGVDL